MLSKSTSYEATPGFLYSFGRGGDCNGLSDCGSLPVGCGAST